MASNGVQARAALAMAVGGRVRALRRGQAAPRNTLSWLAARTGMSISFLSMIENGRRLPSLPALVSLSEALETPIADLLTATPSVQALLEPIAALFRDRRLGRREARRLLAVARKLHPSPD